MANPGRPTNINYRVVADTCQELLVAGEKPGIRKVCERLGGSFSTISVFLQQWQEEQALANKSEPGISDSFRQAVLAEFSRVTNAVTQTLAAQIDSGKGQLKEAQGLLSEYEAKIEELTNALAAQQKTDTQRQLDFERSLAAAQALVEDGAKREASLQKQMNTLRQELQAAELKAAISDIQRQEVEKQNQRLEQEITTIKK